MPRSRFPIYESSLSGAEVCADQLNARKSLALKRNWVNDILSPIMVKEQTESPFTRNVRKVIRSIPKGRVASVRAGRRPRRETTGPSGVSSGSCTPPQKRAGFPGTGLSTAGERSRCARGRGFEEQRKRLIAEGVDGEPHAGRVDLGALSVWEMPTKDGAPPSRRAAAKFLKELQSRQTRLLELLRSEDKAFSPIASAWDMLLLRFYSLRPQRMTVSRISGADLHCIIW